MERTPPARIAERNELRCMVGEHGRIVRSFSREHQAPTTQLEGSASLHRIGDGELPRLETSLPEHGNPVHRRRLDRRTLTVAASGGRQESQDCELPHGFKSPVIVPICLGC
ncbi:hypothetical protein [Sphingomonas sp.]|uniref:hypothetical protein n=1 Tax=Sphingomonas sp. TaxID=28214 RepID=UPI0028A29265|nr:hypothetical protein [Sphingomonas sp.]